MLGHRTSLNKFKNIEIISSIFSDHKGMKLEINHRKRNKKKGITEKPMHQQRNQRKFKKYLETNDHVNTTIQNIGMQQKKFLEGSS